jgi:hypothetical protein
MAKRKKTPEVLIDRGAQERPPTPNQQQNPPADHPSPTINQAVVEPPSDPVAALFPSPSPVLPSPSAISVTLKVSASGDLAGEVEQYVSEALRALPNVRLIQAEAQWTLIVLGVLIQSPSGKTQGTALSAVVTKAATSPTRESAPSGSRLAPAATPATALAPMEVFRGTWLRIGAHQHVQHLCEQIVADFNDRYLDTERGEG